MNMNELKEVINFYLVSLCELKESFLTYSMRQWNKIAKHVCVQKGALNVENEEK